MLTLTTEYEGLTENGIKLLIGDIVEYRGHVPGGMVSVKLPSGETDVAHPGCFKELR